MAVYVRRCKSAPDGPPPPSGRAAIDKCADRARFGTVTRLTCEMVKPEYILIGALLLIAAVAVPAMTDVYLVQSLVLSICTGLGIQ